jgi:hypothetical protein
MALSTAAKIGIGLAVAAVGGAVLLSSPSAAPEPPTPTPDPPRPTPIPGVQGTPTGPAITTVALTSVPDAGPVHRGALRSDGTWTIATTSGAAVAQGKTGESGFLESWNVYARGGVDGVIVRGGIFRGFAVRPPGCAQGFPLRWCWTTTWAPGLQHHDSTTRRNAITRALARARAGA